MAESHVISGLVSKHSELAGQIQQRQQEIAELNGDLDKIASAIKVIEPEFNLRAIKSKIKNPQNRYFRPREANKLLLECFREAQADITSTDLYKAVAVTKGLDLDTMEDRQVKYFKMTLHTTLKRLQESETIQEVERRGPVIVWRLLSSLSG